MRLGPGKDRRMLAQTFREVRETLGLPQHAFARLFGVERALVQEMEEGKLPAALDQRLLKFMLLSINLQKNPEVIQALLREMKNFYGLDAIFEQNLPLVALYEHVLGPDLVKHPWILESVNFHCKALERKRIGSFLLLWAGRPEINGAMVSTVPKQSPAFISFLKKRALFLMPSLYLFLDIDI